MAGEFSHRQWMLAVVSSPDLTDGQKLDLITRGLHCRFETGEESYVSQSTIAGITGHYRLQVLRSDKAAKAAGFLRVSEERKGRSTVYRLDIPVLEEAQVLEEAPVLEEAHTCASGSTPPVLEEAHEEGSKKELNSEGGSDELVTKSADDELVTKSADDDQPGKDCPAPRYTRQIREDYDRAVGDYATARNIGLAEAERACRSLTAGIGGWELKIRKIRAEIGRLTA